MYPWVSWADRVHVIEFCKVLIERGNIRYSVSPADGYGGAISKAELVSSLLLEDYSCGIEQIFINPNSSSSCEKRFTHLCHSYKTFGPGEHNGSELIENIVRDHRCPVLFLRYIICDLLGFGVILIDFVRVGDDEAGVKKDHWHSPVNDLVDLHADLLRAFPPVEGF